MQAHQSTTAAIETWRSAPNASAFPYDAVVADFQRVGKHAVAPQLLEALAGVRVILPRVRGPVASVRLLDRFLDTALDKWDGRYSNPTYLGLSLLPLPPVDDLDHDIAAIERRYDRLLVQLIVDASRFEIAAADGATDLLPLMRPDARTTAKRCRLGLQVAGPAARRLGLTDGVEGADPIAGARRLGENLDASLPPAARWMLRLTMLPVSVVHDEYQFIRVLQSFEATFALVAVHLLAATRAILAARPELALPRLQAAETALGEAAPLFSLVATMQIEAFRTFRAFTEGASAIQSRHYKLVEALCRQPDPARLDSVAYLAVPEVRERVLAGQVSLDSTFAAARAAGRLDAHDLAAVEQAMLGFAATLRRWRRTHYQIAVRMLGERTGTGYTEGSPYLQAVQAIPVFPSLAGEEEVGDVASRGVASLPASPLAPPPDLTGASGRCPFAH